MANIAENDGLLHHENGREHGDHLRNNCTILIGHDDAKEGKPEQHEGAEPLQTSSTVFVEVDQTEEDGKSSSSSSHTATALNELEHPEDGKEPDHPEHGKKPEHPEHGKKPEHPEHGKKPEHPEHGKKPDHPEHGKKPEHPEHGKKPEHPEHGKKPEHPEHGKPEHPEHGKKPEHPEHGKEEELLSLSSADEKKQAAAVASSSSTKMKMNERSTTTSSSDESDRKQKNVSSSSSSSSSSRSASDDLLARKNGGTSTAELKNTGGSSSSSSSSTDEKKKKKNNNKKEAAASSSLSFSSSPEALLDPKVSQWLHALRWRNELETMSVLYAKSVPTTNKPKNGASGVQRVPIRDRPISTSKNDVTERCSMLMAKSHHSIASPGSTSPPAMRHKQPEKFKHGDQQHRSHHRSTVCLSSSTVSPSLVMNRQSIVIVPAAGEGGTEGNEVPFSKSGTAPDFGADGGTLTKFALSLPNGASLGERLMAHRRECTPPSARKPPTTAGHRVPSTTMDYAELPLCEPAGNVYQPRIKYRRNRKGGSSAAVAATACGGAHTLPNQRRRSPFSITDSSPLRSGGLAVRPLAFRHSIRVNELESSELMGTGNRNFALPPSMSMSMFCTSVNKFNVGIEDESPYEEGTGSLDSGQCSGSSPPFFNNCLTATSCSSAALMPPVHHHHYQPLQRCHWHQRRFSDEATSSEGGTSSVEMTGKFGTIERNTNSVKMPSYARTANCIAQVLRLSSIIFAQLGTTLSEHRRLNGTKKLLTNTKAYIRLLAECPCAAQMPQSELELVRRAMQDAEGELLKYDSVQPNDYLGVCIRRMLEQTLLVFVRLISHYLSECANHDQLLLIALEQFVHLLLFGDELCLEAIRHKAVDNLLALALVPLTGSDTLKLLLRTMSVLCGTAKGCIQLLSIGGLELVLRILRDSTHADCSIEAAGCLAQLCSPAHCFLRLSPHSLQPLVPRLLKLVDRSPSPEALLLCLAALANLSAQCAGPTAELLYTHNAVLRLVRAAGREHSAGNLFVQEELVTIFTRMANRGFERALVAQGAIPVLCRLLQLEAVECQSQRQSDFQRRVSYKAAVCLGILASTGSGLRALYEHEVHKVLAKILCPGGVQASDNCGTALSITTTAPPIQLICSSISQRLQHTYHLETAV
uniref:Protein inscuteable homologue C-terminal domain-containing protein n=1 Tax=Globodera rostochiensis TaxID=31243 RepID=A0A914HTC1_GLORO